jgi:hypothetical protein
LVEHPSTDDNPYVFYSYFPRSAAENQEVVVGVWPHGGGFSSEDYSVHKGLAANVVARLASYSEYYQIPIIVVAIPRVESLYVHSLHLGTFTTREKMLNRPDLKLINAVWNQYIPSLREAGFNVDERVLMMGFSSAGMFAHRFTMLHPDKVKAVWLGSHGPAPLPATELDGQTLNYPLGMNNIQKLTGGPFDFKAYSKIPHFICVGENDVNPQNDTTTYTDVFTEEQGQFIRSHFGSSNPERIRFFYEYLASMGVPAQFLLYEGIGHTITDQILHDAFNFLMMNSGIIGPPSPTATPTPALPIVIDGKGEDWIGVVPVLDDPQGDSLRGGDTDLREVYLTQDDNFIFIMIRTDENLKTEQALVELSLDLRQNNPCGRNSELYINILPNNVLMAWEENPCGTHFPFPIVHTTVFWGDVLEIRIPQASLGEHMYVRLRYVGIHTPLNGDMSWAVVDYMEP